MTGALKPDAASSGTWLLGDRTVNRLGFGAMRLTSRPREQALAVLRRAATLGVNHIDTAAFYFSPTLKANDLIKPALHPYAGLTVTTKVGPSRTPDGTWQPLARPDQLRAQ